MKTTTKPIKLGTCARLCARISEAQCKRNRRGVPAAGSRPAVPKRYACDGCTGLTDISRAEV